MSRKVLDAVELKSEGSFIDAELIIRAQRDGFEVMQMGVDYFPRTRANQHFHHLQLFERCFQRSGRSAAISGGHDRHDVCSAR